LLLRAAFGSLHNGNQLGELYDAQTEQHAARLAELREELKEAKKGDDPFRVATLDFAITYQRALTKWLDSAPGR
jgi:hypothetical protein